MDIISNVTALSIDGCSLCQLQCADCKVQKSMAAGAYCFSKGYLKFENFKKIIDEAPTLQEIHFDNIGEFFLNPDIAKILLLGGQRNIDMYISSGVNMNYVNPGALEALVFSQTRELVCALDGATAETYSIYRKGGNFDRVLENIDRLNALKASSGSCYPHLKWQFIVFGHNEHELPLARAMAEERGMEFSPKMAWDPSYSPVRDREFVMKHTGWTAADRDELLASTGKMYSRGMCYFLWRKPRISWDGKVLGCCGSSALYFGGNVFKEGLEGALNHPKLVDARRALMGKLPMRDDVPCAKCRQYLALEVHKEWLTPEEVLPGTQVAQPVHVWRGDVVRRIEKRLEHFIAVVEKGQGERAEALRRQLFPGCASLVESLQEAKNLALLLDKENVAQRCGRQHDRLAFSCGCP